MSHLKMERKGDRFYCNFYHPLLKKTVRCSLGAASTASLNLSKLEWLKDHSEHWRNPPADQLPTCVLEAWKADLAGKVITASEATDIEELRILLSASREENRGLMQHIIRLEREVNELRGQRYDIPDIPIEDAAKKYIASYKGRDTEWTKTAAAFINRFARHWRVNLPQMVGRERDIRSWIEGLGVTPGVRNQYKTVICKFLADSGLMLDRKQIGSWNPKSADPIKWLTREEAQQVAEQLQVPWSHAFRIQVGTALRSSELVTLKKGDLSGDILTLCSGEGHTLKTGTRSIKVPPTTLPILQRLLAKGYAFKVNGKPYKDHTTFERAYRKALAAVTGTPFKIDCRTGRRTCGSLMLRAGKTIEEVAAYMGSDPDTIRAHYARILSSEVDGSAAAI